MRLVRLRHGAVACALPIEQADVAESGTPSAAVLALWETERARHEPDVSSAGVSSPASPGATRRFLRVQTHGGWRSLPCSEVAIADVDDARRWELPPLVRALLALPHVVGVVELDGSPIWLLDLDLVE